MKAITINLDILKQFDGSKIYKRYVQNVFTGQLSSGG